MAEGERSSGGAPPASTVLMAFLRSSVGAKIIMALTGLALWGFIIIHLIGNLQLFQEPEAINAYGVWLRSLGHGTLVWLFRAGLTVVFIVHIVMGLRLAAMNRKARPVGYAKKRRLRTNMAALSMAVTGIGLLVFLVFHLAHTTWGLILPSLFTETTLKDGTPAHDVYRMMTLGFQNPLIFLTYVVGQLLLLAHLFHGTQSLWQSLGIHHRVWSPVLSLLGQSIAVIIVVFNVGMPLYFFVFRVTP